FPCPKRQVGPSARVMRNKRLGLLAAVLAFAGACTAEVDDTTDRCARLCEQGQLGGSGSSESECMEMCISASEAARAPGWEKPLAGSVVTSPPLYKTIVDPWTRRMMWAGHIVTGTKPLDFDGDVLNNDYGANYPLEVPASAAERAQFDIADAL